MFDYILNNWTWSGFLSILSFCIACYALYLNHNNTSINKKKFKQEQDDKKKANLVWEEVRGNSSLYGYKTIQISNTGHSDAKKIQIIINDKEFEKITESDMNTEVGYPFNGLKLSHARNNFRPTEISAGLSVTFQVITHPKDSQFITVKFIWDDEFEAKREKTFKYIPGNSKLAN
ncbi:hypothetical protein [Lysinibacillus capsici]|uniref:hypothetical protein n=1 Tax=Lysinibacillus capsici TaxID=2115968 RepID=UPI0034E24061